MPAQEDQIADISIQEETVRTLVSGIRNRLELQDNGLKEHYEHDKKSCDVLAARLEEQSRAAQVFRFHKDLVHVLAQHKDLLSAAAQNASNGTEQERPALTQSFDHATDTESAVKAAFVLPSDRVTEAEAGCEVLPAYREPACSNEAQRIANDGAYESPYNEDEVDENKDEADQEWQSSKKRLRDACQALQAASTAGTPYNKGDTQIFNRSCVDKDQDDALSDCCDTLPPCSKEVPFSSGSESDVQHALPSPAKPEVGVSERGARRKSGTAAPTLSSSTTNYGAVVPEDSSDPGDHRNSACFQSARQEQEQGTIRIVPPDEMVDDTSSSTSMLRGAAMPQEDKAPSILGQHDQVYPHPDKDEMDRHVQRPNVVVQNALDGEGGDEDNDVSTGTVASRSTSQVDLMGLLEHFPETLGALAEQEPELIQALREDREYYGAILNKQTVSASSSSESGVIPSSNTTAFSPSSLKIARGRLASIREEPNTAEEVLAEVEENVAAEDVERPAAVPVQDECLASDVVPRPGGSKTAAPTHRAAAQQENLELDLVQRGTSWSRRALGNFVEDDDFFYMDERQQGDQDLVQRLSKYSTLDVVVQQQANVAAKGRKGSPLWAQLHKEPGGTGSQVSMNKEQKANMEADVEQPQQQVQQHLESVSGEARTEVGGGGQEKKRKRSDSKLEASTLKLLIELRDELRIRNGHSRTAASSNDKVVRDVDNTTTRKRSARTRAARDAVESPTSLYVVDGDGTATPVYNSCSPPTSSRSVSIFGGISTPEAASPRARTSALRATSGRSSSPRRKKRSALGILASPPKRTIVSSCSQDTISTDMKIAKMSSTALAGPVKRGHSFRPVPRSSRAQDVHQRSRVPAPSTPAPSEQRRQIYLSNAHPHQILHCPTRIAASVPQQQMQNNNPPTGTTANNTPAQSQKVSSTMLSINKTNMHTATQTRRSLPELTKMSVRECTRIGRRLKVPKVSISHSEELLETLLAESLSSKNLLNLKKDTSSTTTNLKKDSSSTTNEKGHQMRCHDDDHDDKKLNSSHQKKKSGSSARRSAPQEPARPPVLATSRSEYPNARPTTKQRKPQEEQPGFSWQQNESKGRARAQDKQEKRSVQSSSINRPGCREIESISSSCKAEGEDASRSSSGGAGAQKIRSGDPRKQLSSPTSPSPVSHDGKRERLGRSQLQRYAPAARPLHDHAPKLKKSAGRATKIRAPSTLRAARQNCSVVLEDENCVHHTTNTGEKENESSTFSSFSSSTSSSAGKKAKTALGQPHPLSISKISMKTTGSSPPPRKKPNMPPKLGDDHYAASDGRQTPATHHPPRTGVLLQNQNNHDDHMKFLHKQVVDEDSTTIDTKLRERDCFPALLSSIVNNTSAKMDTGALPRRGFVDQVVGSTSDKLFEAAEDDHDGELDSFAAGLGGDQGSTFSLSQLIAENFGYSANMTSAACACTPGTCSQKLV
ncbi:unnamed protein product [Amoebophrya sp. A25]|nr:unnamed protein product [Amoebophrya sp. A25]|eukprot:GSA25T00011611001.1